MKIPNYIMRPSFDYGVLGKCPTPKDCGRFLKEGDQLFCYNCNCDVVVYRVYPPEGGQLTLDFFVRKETKCQEYTK